MRRTTPSSSRLLLGAAALLLAGASTSCRTQREFVFESQPPGAQVRLDGELVGRTPLTLPFEAYGIRRVTILRKGYRSYSEDWAIDTPWYSQFPLDYFSEILLPFGWEDIHRLEVVLEPYTGEVHEPDFQAVLRRAESLRRGGPDGPNQIFPGPATSATPEPAAQPPR